MPEDAAAEVSLAGIDMASHSHAISSTPLQLSAFNPLSMAPTLCWFGGTTQWNPICAYYRYMVCCSCHSFSAICCYALRGYCDMQTLRVHVPLFIPGINVPIQWCRCNSGGTDDSFAGSASLSWQFCLSTHGVTSQVMLNGIGATFFFPLSPHTYFSQPISTVPFPHNILHRLPFFPVVLHRPRLSTSTCISLLAT